MPRSFLELLGAPPALGLALAILGAFIKLPLGFYKHVPEDQEMTVGKLRLPALYSQTRRRLNIMSNIFFWVGLFLYLPVWPRSSRGLEEAADDFKDFSTDYAAIINLLFTACVVCLTAGYVVLTRRMWKEMADARIARIRPLIYAVLEEPIFNERPSTSSIRCRVVLTNFGSGPAFDLQGTASFLYERPGEATRIITRIDKLPISLAIGESCQVDFSIRPFPTPISFSRKDFLELSIDWKDSEGNQYTLVRVYDLLVLLAKHWQLYSEHLWFGPFPQYYVARSGISPGYRNMKVVRRYEGWAGRRRRLPGATASDPASESGRKVDESEHQEAPNKGPQADA